MNLTAIVTLLQLALSLLSNSRGTASQSQALAFANQAMSLAQNAIVSQVATSTLNSSHDTEISTTTPIIVNTPTVNSSTSIEVVGKIRVTYPYTVRNGSYFLTASQDEDIKITSISMELIKSRETPSQGLKIVDSWGKQFGTTQKIHDQFADVYHLVELLSSPYIFSGDSLIIPAGNTVNIHVEADATSTKNSYCAEIVGVSGVGVISNDVISGVDDNFSIVSSTNSVNNCW
jgi:hypothetical protein